MPVTIGKRPINTEKRGNRGRHFDKAVVALAPDISALREKGIRTVRHLAGALNAAGKRTQDGKLFNRETLRRMLLRMAKLHLGVGPQSASVAANHRRSRRRSPEWARSISCQSDNMAGASTDKIADRVGRCAGGHQACGEGNERQHRSH